MPTEPTTPAEAIESAALDGVQSVTSDGTTVRARPVDELIKADRYLEERSARSTRRAGRFPFKMFRLRPGGMQT